MRIDILNNFFAKNFKKKAGFTLAELLIVLAVLAVIAAVLMPTVFDSMPDENKLKFKKGYYTLKRTIDQMVNSEFYEGNEGEFGKVLISTSDPCPFGGAAGGTAGSNDCKKMFCIQFSEMLNSTYAQCERFKNESGVVTNLFDVSDITRGDGGASDIDTKCQDFPGGNLSSSADTHKVNVVTQDGIYWSLPLDDFSGVASSNQGGSLSGVYAGIPKYYGIICMDVDGPGGEDAFAFGIRRDGKVVAGAKAKAWLQEGNTTTVTAP